MADIGPIRKSLLDQAYSYAGGLLNSAADYVRPAPDEPTGYGLAGLVNKGVDALRSAAATQLSNTGGLLDDASNQLPPVRLGYGNRLMSLQADQRIPDAVMTATDLGSLIPLARHVVTGVAHGLGDAATGYLEDIARGVPHIIAGPKAKTADLSALAKAQELDTQMPETPAKRDLILRETGWYKGKDGNWRFEIDDSNARLGDRLTRDGALADRPLNEAMQHDALAAAYPELMNETRVTARIAPGKRGGEYRPAKNTIGMKAPDAESMRNGLLHEIEHNVQTAEGFAPGGSPDSASGAVERLVSNLPYLSLDEKPTISQMGLLAHYTDDPKAAYKALAGETEARAVEARSRMTPAERKATPPYKSYDVPESQQLVLTGNRDVPVMMADGSNADRPRLKGLPDLLNVPGHGAVPVAPSDRVRQVASDYTKAAGIDYNPTDSLAQVNPEHARAVAKAYDEMPHAPNDPKVKSAYRALANETMAQWNAIKKSGLKVEFIKPGMEDPYKASPRLAINDINSNNHLWVFPSDNGFGGPSSAHVDVSGNPLLADSGEMIDGHPAKVNDIFRIVHDYFGHASEGNGFRANGEETAARLHGAMFSPEARKALMSETRGQNSWVNYGPHGDANRAASGAQTEYAPQKTGLLPDWATEIDYQPPPKPRRRSKGQTVDNPLRTAFPEIYEKSPVELAQQAEKWVEPESPLLQRLFGVSRGDLANIADRSGNMSASLPGVTAKGAGSEAAANVATKANAKRLVSLLDAGREHAPRLTEGMKGWYVMDPLYHKFVAELGPEEGKAAFMRFNTMTGMASPGSDVLTEINRGTTADMLAAQGKFDLFSKFGGQPELHRSKFPREAQSLIGHPYHSTSQAGPMRQYLESGSMQMQSPKVPTYIESSSVPDTGFQTTTPVGDAHWARGVGLADTRGNATRKGKPVIPAASVTNPEIKLLGPWYRDEVARKAGYEAVPAQAIQWGLLGPQTGVDTALGAPKLELLAQQIAKTASRQGITPEEALSRLIRKKGQAGQADTAALAAIAAAGGSAAVVAAAHKRMQ